MNVGSRLSKKKKFLLIVIIVVLILGVISAAYLNTGGYDASAEAKASIAEEHEGYSIYKDGNNIVFAPDEAKTGLIFYPGGKVDYEAYAPLLEDFANEGILCVLVKMPVELAIFGINKADGIEEEFPEIENWYIGGHSLGGAMASMYVAKHTDDFDGLVLLAAYSTKDLTESGLKVLSVYGSDDGVLDRESYDANSPNLPENVVEDVIEGGCHSYFGDYGMQKGDGDPAITREEQMEETAEAFAELIDE